ncbi:MAG TPA: site-2 protease family protein [Fimbriimonas sp.]
MERQEPEGRAICRRPRGEEALRGAKFVGYLLLGALIGVLLAGRPLSADLARAVLVGFVLIVPLALLALFLAIVVHELGHVAGGRLAGMEFRFVQFGPLSIHRQDGRCQMKWIPRSFAGGLAFMVPARHRLVEQYRSFILGGPLASLAWCAICLALYIWAHREPSPAWAPLTTLLFGISLVVLPGTLWPHVVNGYPTDALFLLKLRTPGPERDRILALFEVHREGASGKRARDWSTDLLETALIPQDGSQFELRARYLAYWHCLDRGEWERARDEIERAVSLVKHRDRRAGVVGQAVLLEKAYLLAFFDHDADAAAALIRELKEPGTFVEGIKLRAESAIAWARADADSARDLATKAEMVVEDHARRTGTSIAAESDLLRALMDEPAAV